MRPVWDIQVLSGSWSLEGKLLDRITKVVASESEKEESDSFEMESDDRAAGLPLPQGGEKLRLWMGYGGSTLAHMGDYVIDEVGFTGPPMQMQISGKSVDLVNIDIKAPRPISRDNCDTVTDLAKAIAQEHGLEARIHADVDAIVLGHLVQLSESNLSVLSRIAKQYDLSLRLAAGVLTLRPNAARLPLSDAALGTQLVLRGQDLGRYRWRSKSRDRYDGAQAHWTEPGEVRRRTISVGGDKAVYDVRHDARSEADAKRIAEAKLHQTARETASLSIELPGKPLLRAGARVLLVDIPDPFAGYWSVESVTHTMTKGGYTTSAEMVYTAERLSTIGVLTGLAMGQE